MKTILGFIFLITLLVGIHELGHLIAAKIFNVYCAEYSLGMGPLLYQKKNKETLFSIRLFPIGGYCSLAGESENGFEKRYGVNVPMERTLKGVSWWKQIIIYLAGVTMNFILGYLVIFIAVLFLRPDGIYFNELLSCSFEVFKSFSLAIFDGIKTLFSDPTQVSGIVGIASYVGETVNEGIVEYLLLIALLSINVGIFNLIPLPVMDGGRVLICIIETIIGHQMNKKLEKIIMLVCSVFLILFMLWAMGLDIYRFFQ